MTTATAPTTNNTLETLKSHIAEIQDIRSAQGLLGWDMETFMPAKGTAIRASQSSTLAKLSHQMLTDPKVGDWLKELQASATYQALSKVDQAHIREIQRQYDQETKLPVSLVQAISETTAKAHSVWVEARKTKNFKTFQPTLSELVKLNGQVAECLGYEKSPYDALLDQYEPGLTADAFQPVVDALQGPISELIQRIQASPHQPPMELLANKNFDTKHQSTFTLKVLKDMGFDFDAGRQDEAAHPFTMGMGPHDVRLTTRYDQSDVFSALFSSIHEGGHGLYEQGIDPCIGRTFLDGGASLGIHESQSRLWENQVGRSQAFWQHYYPLLQQAFSSELSNIDSATFYRLVNRVVPSPVRVEADEVTYNLHIFIRFTIEKNLIEGNMTVDDIPGAWQEQYEKLLGITPANDAEGCLQDVHWSHGSFGYFPTYTLGNVVAAQMFETAKTQLPSLEADIAQGKLLPLKTWLNQQVHQWSKVEQPAEIVQRVTGEPMNPKYLLDYFETKYSKLYQL